MGLSVDARRLYLPPCDRLRRHPEHLRGLALREAEEAPDAKNPEALLGDVMRAMALRHLVPARPENPSSLAHHPKEQGALFGPFEQSRRSRPRFPQLPERRAEGEAEKMCGSQEGGKGSRAERTASDTMDSTARAELAVKSALGAPAPRECPSTRRD